MATATDTLATSFDVAAQLRAVEETLLGLAPALVPERLATHQLAGVIGSLGRIERCAGGARIVLAKAAADTDQWKRDGARSAAEWAAKQNGSTVGEAKADIEASAQLANLPAARDAAASGKLSKEATKAVAAGATADSTAERSLLDKGAAGDLAAVREEARRARQRRDERDGKAAQRMYERRQLRTWIEVDGEGRGQWNVPAAYHAVFLAALEPYRREAFKQAHAAGQRPSHEALMADALQMLCLDVLADLEPPVPDAARTDDHQQAGFPSDRGSTGRSDDQDTPPADPFDGDVSSTPDDPSTQPGQPSGASDAPDAGASESSAGPVSGRPGQPRRHRRAPAQIMFHLDVEAWLRGRPEGDEVCEIPGLGPMPVSLARSLSADAVLKLVVRNGDDITTITSHRRYIPAALRAALEARDRECIIPGCHATRGLQIDHTHDFAKGGPTCAANNGRMCWHHHYLKTHCSWVLRGPPGQWTFEPP